ncbi:DNA mismatch repair protein MutL [Bienertia sinuspersici]
MEGPKTSPNAYVDQNNFNSFEQYKMQIIDHHTLEMENSDNASRYCTYNVSPTFDNYSSMQSKSSNYRYVITPYFKPSPSHHKSFDWSFDEGELKRKSRITTYKTYGMETKIKGSLRNGFRWVKSKYSRMVRRY